MRQPIYLGVNVDHVATLRQAHKSTYPDPVHAAMQAELAGADGITMHLREDQCHIQLDDVERLIAGGQTKLNLVTADSNEMLALALRLKPRDVCLVPEQPGQLSSKRGLDVVAQQARLKEVHSELHEAGILVSLFIDPDESQIEATALVGAPVVELNTRPYGQAQSGYERTDQLATLVSASDYAYSLGLIVNAGHGLHYKNVQAVAEIQTLNELNIGHAIVSRALFCGMQEAVRDMKNLMNEARYR